MGVSSHILIAKAEYAPLSFSFSLLLSPSHSLFGRGRCLHEGTTALIFIRYWRLSAGIEASLTRRTILKNATCFPLLPSLPLPPYLSQVFVFRHAIYLGARFTGFRPLSYPLNLFPVSLEILIMTRVRPRASWTVAQSMYVQGKIRKHLPYGFLRMSISSGELARSRRHRQQALPPLRPRYHVFRRMLLKQETRRDGQKQN